MIILKNVFIFDDFDANQQLVGSQLYKSVRCNFERITQDILTNH